MNHPSFHRLLRASRLLQALAATLCLSAAAAHASTLFVATTGVNHPSCGVSLATACKTIQYTITIRALAGDTIRIEPGTYIEILTIDKDLTLIGAGPAKTVINGRRMGTVVTNSAATRIERVAIVDGHGTASVIENLAGGVNNSGYLILDETVITENTAVVGFPNLSGTAGGIVNSGTLILISSQVEGNSADGGCITAGGIANFIDARLLTEDSLILQNASTGSSSAACGGPGSVPAAGGIINNQGMFIARTSTIDANSITNNGTFTLTQSTVSNTTISELAQLYVTNSTLYQAPLTIDYQPGLFAGVIDVSSSTIFSTAMPGINLQPPWTSTIRNSILAGNPGGDCSGDFLSGGFNIVENGAGCAVLMPHGDRVGIPAGLGSFGPHGGPTRTIDLLTGSPAIGGANPAGCDGPTGIMLTVDQRGVARPAPGDGLCDVGSVQD